MALTDNDAPAAMELEGGEPTKVISAREVDAALQFLDNDGTRTTMTEIEEKRLIRKIDWHLMPLMTCCYFLQYLDKTLRMEATLITSTSPKARLD